MNFTKKSVIDMIAFDVEGRGDMDVRIAKLTFLGAILVQRENHRFSLQPGDNVEAAITAVNRDLTELGFGEMEGEGVSMLRRLSKDRWTPERVKSRRKREEQRVKEEEERLRETAKLDEQAAQAERDRIAKLVAEELSRQKK